MGQESLQITESQRTPRNRPGTTWKQMEAITGQSGDAAGMGVVTLNLGELMGTWGQKCSDVKIIHGFISTFFFFLEKGASSFKLWVRIRTQDPNADPQSKIPLEMGLIASSRNPGGEQFSLPSQPCLESWVKPEPHGTPCGWEFPRWLVATRSPLQSG